MKKILMLIACISLFVVNVDTVSASSWSLTSNLKIYVTQIQYDEGVLDDYKLYILCTTDDEVIESTSYKKYDEGYSQYYMFTLNSNFRFNENYSYVIYFINSQNVKEYFLTLTNATSYAYHFDDFSPYLQQDENEDDTGTDIEGSTTVVVDLSETNKILNNIFILLVFAFIYCYFLNPFIKGLTSFWKKGD